MTVTAGSGPLASRPADRRNFAIDAPAHRMLREDYPHRLHALVRELTDDVCVLSDEIDHDVTEPTDRLPA